MRILLFGDTSGNLDEGMKKITLELYKKLSERNQVLIVEPRKMFNLTFWRKVRSFSPNILHYVPGPTIRSLIFLKIVKVLSGSKPKTVVSATKPYFSILSRQFIRFLKPNFVLTQSLKFEKFFQKYGCKVDFLPNGVDIEKFRPSSESEKHHLRRKYKIESDKFIVLHVGHLKKNRNLEILAEIKKLAGFQVIVVGGTSMPMDVKVKNLLEESGCIVWRRYFENIAEIYGLADCFVFPTQDLGESTLYRKYNQIGAVDLPLSVLEAMACNLPVISTRFGALTRLFEPGDGFFYFKDQEDLFRSLTLIKHGLEIRTREKVMMLDWNRIVLDLEREYMRVCGCPTEMPN